MENSPDYLASMDEDDDLVRRARSGDQRAWDRLVIKYRPMVYKQVKTRLPQCRSLTRDDLEQAGMEALIRSVLTYDEDAPTFFISLVRANIFFYVKNAVLGDSTVSMGRPTRAALAQVAAKRKRSETLPSVPDLVRSYRLSDEVAQSVLTGEVEEEVAWLDSTSLPELPDHRDDFTGVELAQLHVDALIETLHDETDRQIVGRTFGIGRPRQTKASIAKALGISDTGAGFRLARSLSVMSHPSQVFDA